MYEEEIPIKIKGYDREEYNSKLVIKIAWSMSGNHHSTLLHVEITDPLNM